MQNASAWMLALAGFGIGTAAGFFVRHARLCSFGAIEDALMGGDTRRLRIFGLALGVAIIGTQLLVVAGLLDPQLIGYTPSAIPLLSIAIGSVMFGVGMAMVGTCGFGSLVRLGSGDLRSLVVILVLGGAAYATLRGVFAGFRITALESVALPMPDGIRADLASLLQRAFGYDLRNAIAAIAGVGLCAAALGDRRLRRAPRLLMAGIALGVLTVAGWFVTTWLADEFAGPLHPQSLTFVSTIGKALYAGVLDAVNFADFGVGTVFGVVAGSWLAARRADELRWEAFDDDHEMRRHLGGAVLMGIGGILTGGCTIGQGVTAGSVLALSWPLAVGGMMLGARLGIAVLVEGSPADLLHRGWISLRGWQHPSE
ncbi:MULTISPECIES: YeeE/YedE family protein [Rhodopseudomonas]|uniref:Lipocalin n=1 Tax=Rhodopseudomonas palustris TaxID=1076 RepID=A0A0D7EWF4_RHOPL|nr:MULTISPECIES: YeeE/YedE family protein [Rhodopseudomonas]KIZ43757.1 lipocalin [Rhodopseudomonas palustris]MDF3810807.1 YeeE/YedE family protein [Rhodopseudomonas sp. BAL398]WOK17328.1 YeeE/YedE family protein [Rhodopseudomonas sp. BAL398]